SRFITAALIASKFMILAPFALSLPSSANETFVDIAVSIKRNDKADTTKIIENQLFLLGGEPFYGIFISLMDFWIASPPRPMLICCC
ncbi:MAG: hypothetical protein Q8L43_03690, partial [Deltaproteobacteria bacterium]|nr:hypothetical protein [Deltaproteobacteria bacterium]